MSIRESFVEHFGEDQAVAIERAAKEHGTEIGATDRGSDPFKWAICICIGFECMSAEGYREYHGITAPWDKIDGWIKLHANLAEHDGDIDCLGALAGCYDAYMAKATVQ